MIKNSKVLQFAVLFIVFILLSGCSNFDRRNINNSKMNNSQTQTSRLFDNHNSFISTVKNNLNIPSSANVTYSLGTPSFQSSLNKETVYITFTQNNQTVASAECSTETGELLRSIQMYSAPSNTNQYIPQAPPIQTPYVQTPPSYVPPKSNGSTYYAEKSNASWSLANSNAYRTNGHLVYIDSEYEFNQVCAIAEAKNINVFWVGASKGTNDSWGSACWGNGYPILYTKWYKGEPSYISEKGQYENYLMVFKIGNKWYYNDGPNDISYAYSGKMGYIVEYEY